MGKVLQLFDGLANILTGRGTSVDRMTHNIWVNRTWTDVEVATAYRSSWLHRKIVDIPAEDMTRAGRDWDAEKQEIEAIEAEERRLGVWAKLRQAIMLGRLGGGAILIGLGDDPANELPSSIGRGKIQYLTVLSRHQLTLGDMVLDPASPLFGQPEYFTLSGTSQQVRIHPSRLVCFHGLPVPVTAQTSWQDAYWGDSVPQVVDEAIQHASTATAGFASLIDEAKIDVFRFAGLVEQLMQPDGEAKVMQRTQLTQSGKSIHRAVILDKEDEWEQRQVNWAGMRDVIVTYDGRVAGAADIPATRLFGKAPDGMNATGDGDMANYFQGIGAKQEMHLRPAMEKLDAVVLPSAGVTSKPTWAFSPLAVLTEQQAADIEAKEAESVTKYANAGMIPESALSKVVINRLVESQRWPGLAEAVGDAEAAGEELPDDELDIVPTEGGGPGLAGGASGSGRARRAANDKRGGTPNSDRPFEDGYNRGQPRDGRGRWISSGHKFAEIALADRQQMGTFSLGSLSKRARAQLDSLGVRSTQASVALEAGQVRHAMRRHSSDSRGQAPLTTQDFGRARMIFNEGSISRGTPTMSKSGSPRLHVTAEISGTRYAAAYEARKYRVVLVSLRKRG